MKKINKYSVAAVASVILAFAPAGQALAATKVVMGTAANFAVLAGTPGITNVPTSAITGDVGLSPASGAGYTGLTTAQVTGTIYAVDGAGPAGSVNNPGLLTIAKNDLTAAYLDAAGQTPSTVVPTELGGTTKLPGIYTSGAGTFQITGTLTLDAQGDPNAVFIFQMPSTLTTAVSSSVVLANGAQACNIFWQVGSSTGVIGATSTFKGTVLALTSINVNSGANIEGRVLARNGAVTLAANTITRPATCITTAASTAATAVPGLPNTGLAPADKRSVSWSIAVPAAMATVLTSLFLVRKRWASSFKR